MKRNAMWNTSLPMSPQPDNPEYHTYISKTNGLLVAVVGSYLFCIPGLEGGEDDTFCYGGFTATS